mmetsp:Transcript_71521/g.213402  ORF Transcript_71521/g.213402 Transcript_71521/m.213402 type:complete len:456 (-) Transcript_71521:396-1763(-)
MEPSWLRALAVLRQPGPAACLPVGRQAGAGVRLRRLEGAAAGRVRSRARLHLRRQHVAQGPWQRGAAALGDGLPVRQDRVQDHACRAALKSKIQDDPLPDRRKVRGSSRTRDSPRPVDGIASVLRVEVRIQGLLAAQAAGAAGVLQRHRAVSVRAACVAEVVLSAAQRGCRPRHVVVEGYEVHEIGKQDYAHCQGVADQVFCLQRANERAPPGTAWQGLETLQRPPDLLRADEVGKKFVDVHDEGQRHGIQHDVGEGGRLREVPAADPADHAHHPEAGQGEAQHGEDPRGPADANDGHLALLVLLDAPLARLGGGQSEDREGLLRRAPVLHDDGHHPQDQREQTEDDPRHWLVQVRIHLVVLVLLVAPQFLVAEALQHGCGRDVVDLFVRVAVVDAPLEHSLHPLCRVGVVEHVVEDTDNQRDLQRVVQEHPDGQHDLVDSAGLLQETKEGGIPH